MEVKYDLDKLIKQYDTLKGGCMCENDKAEKEYKCQETIYVGGNPNVDIVVEDQVVEPYKKKLFRASHLNNKDHDVLQNLLKNLFD